MRMKLNHLPKLMTKIYHLSIGNRDFAAEKQRQKKNFCRCCILLFAVLLLFFLHESIQRLAAARPANPEGSPIRHLIRVIAVFCERV